MLVITVGHRTFSIHIAQISELSCVCADIMSRHILEQQFSTVGAYSHIIVIMVDYSQLQHFYKSVYRAKSINHTTTS